MQFDSFSEFLSMGGYALYVWMSYGMGLIVLVGLVINTRKEHQAQLKNLRGILKREMQQSRNET